LLTQAYHLSCLKSARSIFKEDAKIYPEYLRENVECRQFLSLSGMRTLLYKLGLDLNWEIKLGFRDKWAMKQTSFCAT
ncbi:MAG: hypothetical protein AB2769_11835, partial [Paenibacillus sp.]